MIAAAPALALSLMLSATAGPGLREGSGEVEVLPAPASSVYSQPPRLLTLRDAPTTSTQAFTASALTGLTGIAILAGLAEGPPRQLPMSDLSFHARVATGLLLLSVGPSVGDWMNRDVSGFLAGGIGRTALVALGWGALSLAASSQDSAVIGTSVLFMTLAGLVWLGWGATDLVRSLFAPERWVDRQNQERRGVRVSQSISVGRP